MEQRATALSFEPMDKETARAVLGWRYDPPYDVYNTPPEHIAEGVQLLLNPANAYHKVVGPGDDVVAYCCFGPDGQVPGGDYTLDALDIGLGVRPDLTGKGQGSTYVAAVLSFASEAFGPIAYRVTIAEFNQRARSVWQKVGFRVVQTFLREGDDLPFCVLTLQVQPPTHDEQVYTR
jgi:RimJ/RimL family protein N-acetyltransferase